MERPVSSGVASIEAAEYQPYFDRMQHLFLVGDLQLPCPHPFFRDARVEVIACQYAAGGHGRFHWHPAITEYEMVLEGQVSYVDAATGQARIYRAGDFATVPAGVCVKRLIDEPCRTLAIKVPSGNEKIHCRECARECEQRVESFEQQ
jgi:mannose-6-phosphate isomerase-like protein (cupin superfamily)